MLPTWDQIQRSAYERWERRGGVHGADQDDWVAAEMDLAFQLNYRPAAEYPLASAEPVLVGARPQPGCRFCERGAPRAKFTGPRPIVPEVVAATTLRTGEICDECHEQFEGSIDVDFARFWRSLLEAEVGGPPPATVSIGAYKALVRMAVAIMPARELQHFADTLEWVGNPDHDFDSSLFGGTGCLVYRTHAASEVPWVSLSRRTDPDAPLPYAVFVLVAGANVVEIAPPLCSRDQDQDEAVLRLPARSFTTGFGGDARSATRRLLPLERSERPRRRGMRLFA
ncbi:DUF2934 domain-containing protein [Paludisphaera mucosa]|uniref:DUF2934 domain-containing protein n=1 Tax=Paludisphaera mucosa TaxID=3030827 RepID=A0ABT6FFV7_9BACT|nr:DUF2934 domain-containing protein [Paludisphaera mucosa]MDG3006453.1 DUF2934 domain-containing protein [Paludisphaera mucosa]